MGNCGTLYISLIFFDTLIIFILTYLNLFFKPALQSRPHKPQESDGSISNNFEEKRQGIKVNPQRVYFAFLSALLEEASAALSHASSVLSLRILVA